MLFPTFQWGKPDGADGGPAFADDTRTNLRAILVAAMVGGGVVPGWDGEAQETDGTAPPSNTDEPPQLMLSSGTHRIRIRYTYGTSGLTDGAVTTLAAAYSSDSGSTWSAEESVTLTYDGAGNVISWTWS